MAHTWHKLTHPKETADKVQDKLNKQVKDESEHMQEKYDNDQGRNTDYSSLSGGLIIFLGIIAAFTIIAALINEFHLETSLAVLLPIIIIILLAVGLAVWIRNRK